MHVLPVLVVQAHVLECLLDPLVVDVVQHDQPVHRQQLVRLEEIEEGVIEGVPAVDENEVELEG